MNPREMGDAIAAACNWSTDTDPTNDCLYRTKDGRGMFNPAVCLNAMHEAEEALTPDQVCALIDHLEYLIRLPENTAFGDKPNKKFPLNHFGRFSVAHATAAQRAEAFLRALNLWGTHDT